MEIKRIAITGPESTGKSELAEALAQHYNTVYVPEYAREYLRQRDGKYRYEDIVAIAKGQLKKEEETVDFANEYLFCDTDLFVPKIWSEYKFGKCDGWILEKILYHRYDLHLLMDTDIEWEPDPLRENPGDRDELFNIYLQQLSEYKFPFFIISGRGKERLEAAVEVINNFFLYIA